ncbi:hypothetical protein [Micromonospora sp. NPDC047074]|uniref:hypothetical protein n=1 Tax=Micromonospora sp. NPDC047074 TaxID=3154339 RepID=UPI0033E8D8EF
MPTSRQPRSGWCATSRLRLYRRQGRHYVEQSAAKRGEALEIAEPVRATIRPEQLVP